MVDGCAKTSLTHQVVPVVLSRSRVMKRWCASTLIDVYFRADDPISLGNDSAPLGKEPFLFGNDTIPLGNEHALLRNELDEHTDQLDGSEIHPDAGLIQMDREFVLMDAQRKELDERAGRKSGTKERDERAGRKSGTKERDERAGRKGGAGGRVVRQGRLLFQLPSASSSRAEGDTRRQGGTQRFRTCRGRVRPAEPGSYGGCRRAFARPPSARSTHLTRAWCYPLRLRAAAPEIRQRPEWHPAVTTVTPPNGGNGGNPIP